MSENQNSQAPHTTITFLPPKFENIPLELQEFPQWVAWFAAEKPGKTKPDKIPLNPKTGAFASTADAATWGSYEQAKLHYMVNAGKPLTIKVSGVDRTGLISGVGFVLTEGDPFVGIDLDACVTEQGQLELWAREIVEQVASYSELSPSGNGVRIFVKGKLPGALCRVGKVELYQRGRYLTVTGRVLPKVEA